MHNTSDSHIYHITYAVYISIEINTGTSAVWWVGGWVKEVGCVANAIQCAHLECRQSSRCFTITQQIIFFHFSQLSSIPLQFLVTDCQESNAIPSFLRFENGKCAVDSLYVLFARLAVIIG